MTALPARAAAEAAGSALLLAAIVGSGIMAERLSGGNEGLALLANAFATAGALYALIAAFGPVSGAHFNPVVTLALAWEDRSLRADVPAYLLAQAAGALAGVALAHAMFGLDIFQTGVKARDGANLWLAEAVATFGLLLVVLLTSRRNAAHVPASVACYIAGAYWFTASTSFANPAVTLARAFTGSFAGIRPADTPGFFLAQLAGAALAVLFARRLR